MCGIFGFVTNKQHQATEILEGLKTLEYRGYDSWGVAVKSGESINFQKNIGKIGDAKINLGETKIGIGHTRWATHGGVTVKNAHPHLDCKKQIALIHNGIIENYQSLKEDLIKKGHKFISETDTEVAVHLIEEFNKTKDFSNSVRLAFNKFEGMNAIVVMSAVSSEIVAAKSGSPLIIGKAKDGFYLSSDLSAMNSSSEFLFLKDNEMVILGKTLKLLSVKSGKTLSPVFEKIPWKVSLESKGSFEHFMLKEIFEEPKVIRNIEKNYPDNVSKLSKLIEGAYGTFLIGSGTAYFACLAGSYLFSKIAKKHVNTLPASEFNYLEDFLTKKSLIIALSQSGETIDVVEPLQRAKEKGSKIAALTNVIGSTIYRMADKKFLLLAGPEKAVASTKAYIAKLSILLMVSYALKKNLTKAQKILEKTALEIEKILSKDSLARLKRFSEKLSKHENIYILGRGLSYASSLEAALKIKEVSYIHAEGLAGGELKHGPIALISKGTPCIVFAPNDETYSAIISNAAEIKARGGYIIGISFEENSVFDEFIKIEDNLEGSYIAQIVPVQILAYYLALKKGYDPDKPRNLAKSVTVK